MFIWLLSELQQNAGKFAKVKLTTKKLAKNKKRD